jgi:general secretion pathway protein B
MSYILEALKKSDNKRPRGTVPDLYTDHTAMTHEPKRRSLKPYLLVLALLLNAGICGWWLRPWQSERPSAATLEPASAESMRKTSEVALPVAAPAIKPPDVAQTDQQDKPALATKIEPRESLETSLSIEQQRAQAASPSPAEPSAPVELDSKPKILGMDELPLPVRQDLPDISFSLHYYTVNPSARMVRVNDRIVREGQELAPGLILEEITPTGVVFGYQGYRFHMGDF